jgi:hypothetical protein
MIELPVYSNKSFDWSFQTAIRENIEKSIKTNPVERPRLEFLKGLCYANGFGVAQNPNLACQSILEAARLGYAPAIYTYRRIHGALFSIAETGDTDQPEHSEYAMRDIDPSIFQLLDRLESESPDNYLPRAIGISQRQYWGSRIYMLSKDVLSETTEIELAADPIKVFKERLFLTRHDALESDVSSDAEIVLLINHFIAIAIIHDVVEEFFQTVCHVIKQPFSFNVHLVQVPEAITPLLLACRIGNANAARYLAERYDTATISVYDQIPLHFLFTFPEEDIPEMCHLLCRDLEPDNNYHSTKSIYIVDQLCRLDGNPLSFAIDVGSRVAVKHLLDHPFVQTHWLPRQNGGPPEQIALMLAKLLSAPDSLSKSTLEICHSLAAFQHSIHHLLMDKLLPLPDLTLSDWYSENEHDQAFALLLAVITTLTAIRRHANWVLHGSAYWSRQVQVYRILNDQFGSETLRRVLQKLPLFSIVEDAHAALAVLKLAEEIMTENQFQKYKVEADSFAVANGIKSPLSATCLGIALGKGQSVDRVSIALHLAYQSQDPIAFRRLLEKAFLYRIDWRGCDLGEDTLYHRIASTPSSQIRLFLQLLQRCGSYRAPGYWRRWLTLNYWFLNYYDASSAIGDALAHGNTDNLLAFLETATYPFRTFPYRANILHLACSNDRFVGSLQALLSTYDQDTIFALLSETTSRSKLTPILVAYYTGSCQCLQTLLQYYQKERGRGLNDLVPLIEAFNLVEYAVGTHAGLPLSAWYSGPRPFMWPSEIIEAMEHYRFLLTACQANFLSIFGQELGQESSDQIVKQFDARL